MSTNTVLGSPAICTVLKWRQIITTNRPHVHGNWRATQARDAKRRGPRGADAKNPWEQAPDEGGRRSLWCLARVNALNCSCKVAKNGDYSAYRLNEYQSSLFRHHYRRTIKSVRTHSIEKMRGQKQNTNSVGLRHKQVKLSSLIYNWVVYALSRQRKASNTLDKALN